MWTLQILGTLSVFQNLLLTVSSPSQCRPRSVLLLCPRLVGAGLSASGRVTAQKSLPPTEGKWGLPSFSVARIPSPYLCLERQGLCVLCLIIISVIYTLNIWIPCDFITHSPEPMGPGETGKFKLRNVGNRRALCSWKSDVRGLRILKTRLGNGGQNRKACNILTNSFLASFQKHNHLRFIPAPLFSSRPWKLPSPPPSAWGCPSTAPRETQGPLLPCPLPKHPAPQCVWRMGKSWKDLVPSTENSRAQVCVNKGSCPSRMFWRSFHC